MNFKSILRIFFNFKMDIEQTVLFYSKYSEQSKKFLSQLTQELRVLLNITDVCIDNEQFRKMILTDKKFNIKVVPCLVVKSKIDIMKYEGIQAFSYVDKILMELESQRKMEENRKLQELKAQFDMEQEQEKIRIKLAQEEEKKQNMLRFQRQQEDHAKMNPENNTPPIPINSFIDTYPQAPNGVKKTISAEQVIAEMQSARSEELKFN